jgi:PBP1b-binding outer membrane lipoprotein LpoB
MTLIPNGRNLLIALFFLAGCSTAYNPMDDYEQVTSATILESPAPAPEVDYPTDMVNRGRYMVGLLGCGSCHTNGAMPETAMVRIDPDRIF